MEAVCSSANAAPTLAVAAKTPGTRQTNVPLTEWDVWPRPAGTAAAMLPPIATRKN